MTISAKPLVGLMFLVLMTGAALSSPSFALTREEARHLLVRSGFSAEPAGIEALAPLSHQAAVGKILSETRRDAITPPPVWTDNWSPAQWKKLSQEERRVLRKQVREQALELKAWWMEELSTSPSPLTEGMTLFWHNHFTSSLRKVKAPVLLYRQNRLLRREALGNFGRMLHAVARDPAMLIYLDGARSRKDAPNENFARELLELFTLGEGHYQEADLKEAARAFTGWSIDRKAGAFIFRRRWHDSGEKTFLGRQGVLDGDDVINALLEHPRTAVFIVEKLWRRFISEQPDTAEVSRLANLFRTAGYEIKPLLTALFNSDAFWAPQNRGRLIKAPVDFVVGTVRLFDLPVKQYADLARLSRRLGQDLFDPPNVKGWPGGKSWITAASLLDRQALLERITGGTRQNLAQSMATQPVRKGGRTKRARLFDTWVAELPEDWKQAEAVSLLLLAIPPVDAEILDREASGAQVRQLLGDPVYQLK